MEYIYAALTIHKAGGKVEEASVKKVLTAAGVTPDDARVKALVASLEGVNIDEAIEKSAAAPIVAAPAASGDAAPTEEKKEDKKEEEKKKDEGASAAGLGALFG